MFSLRRRTWGLDRFMKQSLCSLNQPMEIKISLKKQTIHKLPYGTVFKRGGISYLKIDPTTFVSIHAQYGITDEFPKRLNSAGICITLPDCRIAHFFDDTFYPDEILGIIETK
jgi:hypothetical protein